MVSGGAKIYRKGEGRSAQTQIGEGSEASHSVRAARAVPGSRKRSLKIHLREQESGFWTGHELLDVHPYIVGAEAWIGKPKEVTLRVPSVYQ